MSSYIESAKASIRKIMETIQASEKRDVQFALISYRDHTDDYVTHVFPFTGSVSKAKEYVNTMSAHGGGDTPEAVADALADALKLPYRKSATKIVVIVADAPPHGVGFGNDSYPEGSPNKHDPIAIAQEMAKREIVLYSVGCEPQLGRTPFAQDLFKGLSQITGGRYVALGNSKILPDVIIGGAEEEMRLEKIRAQIEEETKAVEKEEREKNGDKAPLDEKVVTQKVTERLQTKGIEAVCLRVDDIGGGSEKTEASDIIAQCNTLPEARKLLKQLAPPPQPTQHAYAPMTRVPGGMRNAGTSFSLLLTCSRPP